MKVIKYIGKDADPKAKAKAEAVKLAKSNFWSQFIANLKEEFCDKDDLLMKVLKSMLNFLLVYLAFRVGFPVLLKWLSALVKFIGL